MPVQYTTPIVSLHLFHHFLFHHGQKSQVTFTLTIIHNNYVSLIFIETNVACVGIGSYNISSFVLLLPDSADISVLNLKRRINFVWSPTMDKFDQNVANFVKQNVHIKTTNITVTD